MSVVEKRIVLLTVKEVAPRLTLSGKSVYRLIKDKKLPAIKVSADRKGRRYRVEEEEVNRFLQRYRTMDEVK
jgi:excisionase family DNA binding protein